MRACRLAGPEAQCQRQKQRRIAERAREEAADVTRRRGGRVVERGHVGFERRPDGDVDRGSSLEQAGVRREGGSAVRELAAQEDDALLRAGHVELALHLMRYVSTRHDVGWWWSSPPI
eukprot:3574461-Rhodomonas_salina.1